MRSLPASCYTDPATYERERHAVFATAWHYVGPQSQLARPGDHFAVEVAGWPIVVVNAGDAGLRAHHNVCRHRAGPLVWDGAGSCATFVCRYHGWTYDLDGRLRTARDFGEAVPPDTDLVPARAEVWRGLVFVHLDPDAPALADALGSFADECAGFGIEELTFGFEVVHELRCNWKTYADNYLEGYHLPFVHPELTKEVDVRRYTVTVHDDWCRHDAPRRDGAVNAGRWLWRYPNLAVNLYADAMNVERFLPVGHDRTRVVYHYWFRDPDDPANAAVERMSRTVLDEDRAICEAVQRNLDAGVYDTGVLSPKHENGVAAFQARIAEALRQ